MRLRWTRRRGRTRGRVPRPCWHERPIAALCVETNGAGSGSATRPRARFPAPVGAEGLADAILDLHTDRQLAGLAAILERIEGDLRAAPVESALRLAVLPPG